MTTNDTVRFKITNDRGKIAGRGMNIYQYKRKLKDIIIKKGKSYDIKIVHFLRQVHLDGIESAGVEIERK